MSSIPQITDNGNNVSDFATKFLNRFHIGRLLFKYNAGKCQTPEICPVNGKAVPIWESFVAIDKMLKIMLFLPVLLGLMMVRMIQLCFSDVCSVR